MNGGEVIFKFKGDDKDLEKKTNGVAGKLKGSTGLRSLASCWRTVVQSSGLRLLSVSLCRHLSF